MQFTCPSGFYGAERWILALGKNMNDPMMPCDLAITLEADNGHVELAREYSALGKTVHRIKVGGRFDLRMILQLAKLIRSQQIDIIHTHGYKSDIIGLLAARLCGIKAISTPHGFVGLNDWKLKLYFTIGNKFLKWFDRVVPLSRQLCRDMQDLGVRQDKVDYIQNGVDIDEVDQLIVTAADESEKPMHKQRIGFIGQITQRKNLVDIIDIFNTLAAKHHNLELVLLGDGDQLEEMQAYAQASAAAEAITFLGFRENRLNWLKTFDLFVMTSKLEGIPRCLMEAMAMQIPVAAYDIPGIDQLVTHNTTGLLATYGDQAALADCWEQLLLDKALSEQLAKSGRQFIVEHFSAQRMAHEYSELYQDLLT